jgi:hypothetical protein
MNSRERINCTLNHKQPDHIPMDFGASMVTGMHVSVVYQLRQALGLDKPGTPVKVVEPYQMLGEIKPDLMDVLGIDVVPLMSPYTMFGFKLEDWKSWRTFDGTPVLVPGKFNTQPEPSGDILQYPEGDKSAPPSGRMPKGGFYIDALVRQDPIDDNNLNVEDNLQEFVPVSDELLDHYKNEADRLYKQTDKAVFASFPNMAFGDIALVPATWLKHPKGIRDIEEWYISTVTRRDYIYELFRRQCEVTLEPRETVPGRRRQGLRRLCHRHRLRRPERPFHLAKSILRPLPALSQKGQWLDSRTHPLENLYALLRLNCALNRAHHRRWV